MTADTTQRLTLLHRVATIAFVMACLVGITGEFTGLNGGPDPGVFPFGMVTRLIGNAAIVWLLVWKLSWGALVALTYSAFCGLHALGTALSFHRAAIPSMRLNEIAYVEIALWLLVWVTLGAALLLHRRHVPSPEPRPSIDRTWRLAVPLVFVVTTVIGLAYLAERAPDGSYPAFSPDNPGLPTVIMTLCGTAIFVVAAIAVLLGRAMGLFGVLAAAWYYVESFVKTVQFLMEIDRSLGGGSMLQASQTRIGMGLFSALMLLALTIAAITATFPHAWRSSSPAVEGSDVRSSGAPADPPGRPAAEWDAAHDRREARY